MPVRLLRLITYQIMILLPINLVYLNEKPTACMIMYVLNYYYYYLHTVVYISVLGDVCWSGIVQTGDLGSCGGVYYNIPHRISQKVSQCC